MKVVIQRVSEASVTIEGNCKGRIKTGLLIFVGFETEDTEEDIKWISGKIVNQRIFSDDDNKMNLSVKDIDGNILLISQFTLHATTKKGNRPSFIKAANPNIAIPLYEKCIEQLSSDLGKIIQTGEFGANMKISLLNDGPVTIIMDSKNRE